MYIIDYILNMSKYKKLTKLDTKYNFSKNMIYMKYQF